MFFGIPDNNERDVNVIQFFQMSLHTNRVYNLFFATKGS